MQKGTMVHKKLKSLDKDWKRLSIFIVDLFNRTAWVIV